MEWIHTVGLVIVTLIMIPNIIFAIKCKDGFQNNWNHKTVELLEQIGRFGCFGFMIIDIPGTCFEWWSGNTLFWDWIVCSALTLLYCVCWVICWKKNTVFRALALSILPSAVFLFSGVIRGSVLLTVSAMLFTPCHILISYKNAKI